MIVLQAMIQQYCLETVNSEPVVELGSDLSWFYERSIQITCMIQDATYNYSISLVLT